MTFVDQIEPLMAHESRRARMVRWILDRAEFDEASTKGKIIFDLGRRPGSGEPAVSGVFHPTSEEL